MARTRTITVDSAEVTTYGPAAGYNSKLLEIVTPRGSTYTFENPLSILAKLYDNGGAQVPRRGSLYLFKRAPGVDFGQFLIKIPYAAYYDLSEANQRDVRYNAETKHDLGGGIQGVRLPEDYILEIWADFSVAVDPTQASTLFEMTAQEQN